jgi:transcriptional regulator with XRE-family HTH domain
MDDVSVRTVLSVNIKRERAKKRWSQEDLALESGLHRTFVAHVERGSRNLSLDSLEKLSTALGMPCWLLLKPD